MFSVLLRNRLLFIGLEWFLGILNNHVYHHITATQIIRFIPVMLAKAGFNLIFFIVYPWKAVYNAINNYSATLF